MATGGQTSSSQDAAIEDTTECVVRPCEPCVRNESSNYATVFCKECKELLCDECKKPHTIYRPGKHKLVSILDMNTASVVSEMRGTDICEEHGMKIEFYCEDHDKLCCSTCVLMHRKYDHVYEIASVAEEKYQTLKKTLKIMESATDNIIADCKTSENKLNYWIADISMTIDKVDEMKHRINKLIDQKNNKAYIEASSFKAEELKRIQTTQASFTAPPSSEDSSDLFQELTLQQLVSVDLKQAEGDEVEPLITGLDFMPDGRLIAVDNHNMKCLIFNERLQIQGIPYKFKTYAYDVVCLSKYEFAVTVANMTACLLFVSPDNVISLITELNTSSQFVSMCCITRSNMVVSTLQDPRLVRMITVDGVESDFDRVEFPSKTYKIGESKSTYVQCKNTLVLTDLHANTVYMYDTVKARSRGVTDENIQKPCGACVGPGGTVLVCSTKKHCIVHLTVDGDVIGTYPVDMKFPFSLCMNRKTSILAVSNNCDGDRKLRLYKLSPAFKF
ncbi:hypothetical protein DPMN_135562 [Dreissena polymorpha]|uniref:B box-type domain-containing protein n=1 Tax=Dreissena polymorpha TaxID=45954 RepID=A0A9D4G467_DREPO|nr:hypothetical protein DPMN_135562 [Dreissena polymorpha]